MKQRIQKLNSLKYLIDLNLCIIENICTCLDIKTKTFLASELFIEGGKNERLINICKKFNANIYLTGDSAKNYLDTNLFNKNNIEVEWQCFSHPIYSQINEPFIPYLSCIDLLFNIGENASDLINMKLDK